MSLLNDVMRDLQTRGVLGVPPLAGLQPVSGVPDANRKRSHLLPLLAALSVVTAMAMWQPLGGGGWLPSLTRMSRVAPAEPETAPQSDVQAPVQLQPAIAATGNDLRELFPIDATASELDAATSDISTIPAAEPAAEKAAIAAEPASETVAIVELPPVESDPIAAFPAVESMAVTQPPVPVAASVRTSITRREPGDQDAGSIVARAMQAMRSHDLVTAERLLREALAVDSRDAETWSFLYGVLVAASRPAAAEQALQRGLSTADKPARLAKLYAKTLLDRGDKDAAVGLLASHRPAAATDTEYDAFLAALLQQTGQYAEAGEIYQKLLTVDPNSGSWLIGLAMSHDSLGYRDEALLAFERALASGSLKSPLDRYARRRTAELKAYE